MNTLAEMIYFNCYKWFFIVKFAFRINVSQLYTYPSTLLFDLLGTKNDLLLLLRQVW